MRDRIHLETFLVEWKPELFQNEEAQGENLETFLVEWKLFQHLLVELAELP